jgi:hypothetical protein
MERANIAANVAVVLPVSLLTVEKGQITVAALSVLLCSDNPVFSAFTEGKL